LLAGKQHPPRAKGLRTRSLAQSETPCTWRCPFVGTWEISSVSGQHSGPAHEGKSRTMGMHADEKSDGRMVPVKPRTKPSDSGGGDGGGTAAGQGEGACNACSGQRSGAFTRHLRSIFANDGVLYGCAH